MQVKVLSSQQAQMSLGTLFSDGIRCCAQFLSNPDWISLTRTSHHCFQSLLTMKSREFSIKKKDHFINLVKDLLSRHEAAASPSSSSSSSSAVTSSTPFSLHRHISEVRIEHVSIEEYHAYLFGLPQVKKMYVVFQRQPTAAAAATLTDASVETTAVTTTTTTTESRPNASVHKVHNLLRPSLVENLTLRLTENMDPTDVEHLIQSAAFHCQHLITLRIWFLPNTVDLHSLISLPTLTSITFEFSCLPSTNTAKEKLGMITQMRTLSQCSNLTHFSIDWNIMNILTEYRVKDGLNCENITFKKVQKWWVSGDLELTEEKTKTLIQLFPSLTLLEPRSFDWLHFDMITQFSQLTSINIPSSRNEVPPSFDSLLKTIFQLPLLKHIGFKRWGFNQQQQWSTLFRSLDQLTSLSFNELPNGVITGDAIVSLTSSVEAQTRVMALSFYDCHMTFAEVLLLSALTQCRSLSLVALVYSQNEAFLRLDYQQVYDYFNDAVNIMPQLKYLKITLRDDSGLGSHHEMRTFKYDEKKKISKDSKVKMPVSYRHLPEPPAVPLVGIEFNPGPSSS